ncbi:MAG: NAD(P)H-dependent oxidoreductase subunit E [Thermoplasmatota archaeon]
MVLSPQDKEVLDGFLMEAEGLDSPILFLLHRIQDKLGFIGAQHAEYISRSFGIPLTEVYSAATFYEEFKIEPLGENIIKVCRGIVCHANGSLEIINAIKQVLNIGIGETTPDGRITLLETSCIGQCDGSPAIMVNGEVHRDVDIRSVQEIVSDLMKGGE